MRLSIMLAALVAASATSGCYSEVAYTPGIVYVSPEVGVVVDSPYPQFYVSNAFWRYDAGVWYRATNNGVWIRENPPYALFALPQPWMYAHYHPYGYYYGSRVYYGSRY
jgi:hypothetical protein